MPRSGRVRARHPARSASVERHPNPGARGGFNASAAAGRDAHHGAAAIADGLRARPQRAADPHRVAHQTDQGQRPRSHRPAARKPPVARAENLLGTVKGVGRNHTVAVCLAPGARPARSPPARRPGRRGTLQLRLRRTSWQTPLLGWTGASTRRLYMATSAPRTATPSYAPSISDCWRRVSPEARAYRLYAQAPDHPQRDGARQRRMGS